jgi:hypothetical protein
MEIQIAKLKIEFEMGTKPSEIHKIRGYIGNLLPEDILLHHHLPNGKLLYTYPFVQYKYIGGNLLIMGINDGVPSVLKLFDTLNEVQIEQKFKSIIFKELTVYEDLFEESEFHIPYKFISPWLALNEENYKKYIRTDMRTKRKELLERVLIGNILSMAKCIGYSVESELQCKILSFKEEKVTLKGQPFVGFDAKFLINFVIPDHLGLGKSVSRGFGVIEKCTS